MAFIAALPDNLWQVVRDLSYRAPTTRRGGFCDAAVVSMLNLLVLVYGDLGPTLCDEGMLCSGWRAPGFIAAVAYWPARRGG